MFFKAFLRFKTASEFKRLLNFLFKRVWEPIRNSGFISWIEIKLAVFLKKRDTPESPTSSVMRTGLFSLDLYFLLVGKPLSRGAVRKIAGESFLHRRISSSPAIL